MFNLLDFKKTGRLNLVCHYFTIRVLIVSNVTVNVSKALRTTWQ